MGYGDKIRALGIAALSMTGNFSANAQPAAPATNTITAVPSASSRMPAPEIPYEEGLSYQQQLLPPVQINLSDEVYNENHAGHNGPAPDHAIRFGVVFKDVGTHHSAIAPILGRPTDISGAALNTAVEIGVNAAGHKGKISPLTAIPSAAGEITRMKENDETGTQQNLSSITRDAMTEAAMGQAVEAVAGMRHSLVGTASDAALDGISNVAQHNNALTNGPTYRIDRTIPASTHTEQLSEVQEQFEAGKQLAQQFRALMANPAADYEKVSEKYNEIRCNFNDIQSSLEQAGYDKLNSDRYAPTPAKLGINEPALAHNLDQDYQASLVWNTATQLGQQMSDGGINYNAGTNAPSAPLSMPASGAAKSDGTKSRS